MLKVVEPPTEVNDSALLKDGSVILHTLFDDAIVLLRCCYVMSLPGKYSYCPWYTGYNHLAVPLTLRSLGLQDTLSMVRLNNDVTQMNNDIDLKDTPIKCHVLLHPQNGVALF